MTDWYVLRCLGQREAAASDRLMKAGHSTYLPICQHISRRGYKKTGYLYPGYLFLEKLPEAPWREILDVPGVIKALSLSADGPPHPVPYGVIADLKRRENRAGVIVLRKPWLGMFERGDMVRVKDGPFVGFEGAILSEDDRVRVTVLLKFLGAEREIPLAIGDVEAA